MYRRRRRGRRGRRRYGGGWLRVQWWSSRSRTCYEGAPVGQKKRRTWRISPARGGMRKGEAYGRCTSSPSERVCRVGYEAAEVQGEHQVKIITTRISTILALFSLRHRPAIAFSLPFTKHARKKNSPHGACFSV